ncbi:AzlD domain-containing protein [Parasalinivibrio latis]|uniref:AzlD domain-containing protein n=1 Tax=Parasalinivibrio latis TaxID=2952610 RepID=UPI0030E259A0
MIWLTIFVMTAIIFTSRYVFLEPRLPIRLSARARSLLSFSGPAVMTALWAPIVFIQDGELALSTDNPYLLSALVAGSLAWFTRNVLLTVIISFVVFFVLRQWM